MFAVDPDRSPQAELAQLELADPHLQVELVAAACGPLAVQLLRDDSLGWFSKVTRRDAAREALLAAEHRMLRETVLKLPPLAFTEKAARNIQGAAMHDVYHAGQIALLKKLAPAD